MLVQAFRDGRSSSFLLLDPATGAVVVDDLDPAQDDYVAYEIGDDRLAVVEEDDRAADGCRPTVALFDLAGTRLWSRDVRSGLQSKNLCDDLHLSAAEGDVAAYGLFATTTMLDGRTGEPLWRTRQQGLVGPASAGVQVVDDDRGRSTTGFDIRTGEVLWTTPVRVGGWDVSGGYLAGNLLCDSGACAVVLDIRTGRMLLQVPGVPQVFVPPAKPGGRLGMLTRIDSPERYRARYGYVTLPRLS